MYDIVIKGGTIVDGTGSPPFSGDVGITDGVIASVGKIDDRAHRIFDADGAVVTPGWIDGHTHYDGQVAWDDLLEGSASNGVTTVVMGNCGMGFAPTRPGETDKLIDLMEGVEAIPGTALYEGIPWGAWESFPDYMGFLDQRTWSLDVAAQLAHGPLRLYVMGDRAIGDADATAEDLEQMSKLTEQAVRAGAVGVSTSRIQFHRAMSGYCVPGTFAAEDEILALGDAIRAAEGAVFQAITAGSVGELAGLPNDHSSFEDELRMFSRISRRNDIPVNFTLVQHNNQPDRFQDILRLTAEENGSGARLTPMCSARGVLALTSLATYHMFAIRPTYRRLMHLPREELVAQLRRPEVKAAILSEPDVPIDPAGSMDNLLQPMFEHGVSLIYPLTDPLDYEPTPEHSFAARAAAEGRDPFDFYYDFLLEDDGRAVAMYISANYSWGNLEPSGEMLRDPNSVLGLSDAGAHVSFLCDSNMSTFLLQHWVRDRLRGPRLPLEFAVNKTTDAVAQLYGFTDRGSIAPGKRADLNVIDFENLAMETPELHHDLPAGGGRFLQSARGYLATFVRGEQTRSADMDTGARPGRVARRTA